MFYDQERAIALYHNAARRHEPTRDNDLDDLSRAFPAVAPVLEELQWLRNEITFLERALVEAGEICNYQQKQIDQMEQNYGD